MFSIVSTRFNENTWLENINYRINNNISGCSYGAPYMMSPKIILDSLVFVMEMNNSLNRIEGIGLVRNKASLSLLDKKCKIHTERNYNRYYFQGNYRINRDELERENSELIKIFDYILFKEKTHLKRGIGFTTVPDKLLKHTKCNGLNLINEINKIFIKKFCSDSSAELCLSKISFEKEEKEEKKEKQINSKQKIIIVDEFDFIDE